MSELTVNDNGIQRPMTDAEKAAHKQAQTEAQSYTAELAAAADAKAAALASARTKLAALGLTDDEVAALLGA